MDFKLTQEQKMIAESARQLGERFGDVVAVAQVFKAIRE